MRDPYTQAFQVKQFWRRRNEWGYKPTFVTVWHVDPERDGTDDSCGWFMRSRHGDKAVLRKIERRFAGEWSRQFKLSDGTTTELGMFDRSQLGWPVMSIHGITLNLFFYAGIEVFGSREKAVKFVQKNLCEILLFAENPVDSLHTAWLHKFGIDERESQEDRIKQAASIIYGWMLRESRPWYRHPRWHFWHWKMQFNLLQDIIRWFRGDSQPAASINSDRGQGPVTLCPRSTTVEKKRKLS